LGIGAGASAVAGAGRGGRFSCSTSETGCIKNWVDVDPIPTPSLSRSLRSRNGFNSTPFGNVTRVDGDLGPGGGVPAFAAGTGTGEAPEPDADAEAGRARSSAADEAGVVAVMGDARAVRGVAR